MQILQEAGVRAGAVLSARELFGAPHLRRRGFFQQLTHPEAGTHDYPGAPWKFGKMPLRIRRPAPCFAEHNDYVFEKILEMPREEIERLEKQGVIATVPLR